MDVTTRRPTSTNPTPPSTPRLRLTPTRGRTVLDGGWWPRSWDPVAELPGLVLALRERYGRIRHIMLNINTWDSRFTRLTVGSDVVRFGWFDTLDPTLLVATTSRDDQVDLLVVPPATPIREAAHAMDTAADPANLRRAPEIVSAGSTGEGTDPIPAGSGSTTCAGAYEVWDDEGGHAARPTEEKPAVPIS